MNGGIRRTALLLCALAISCCAHAKTVTGQAQVVDGDSLIVQDQWVRLRDINAPELDMLCKRSGGVNRCGEAAQAALSRFISDHAVTCKTGHHSENGVDYGACSVRGRDISEWMIRNGWALIRRSSKLGDIQKQARAEKVNLWENDYEGRYFSSSYVTPDYLKNTYPKPSSKSDRHQDLVAFVAPEFPADEQHSGQWEIHLTFEISNGGWPTKIEIQSDAPEKIKDALEVSTAAWSYIPPLVDCAYQPGVTSDQTLKLKLKRGKATMRFSSVSHRFNNQLLPAQVYLKPLRKVPSRIIKSFREKRIGGTYIVAFDITEGGHARHPSQVYGFPQGLMTTEAMYIAHMSEFPLQPERGCFRLEI